MSDCCEVLAWFAQKIRIQVAVLCSLIIAIIVPIIAIMANNSINRARIDTVAALMQ